MFEMNDDLKVFYKGELKHYINPELVFQQGLNDDEIEQLKELHVQRFENYFNISVAVEEGDEKALADLLKEFTECEFHMQKVWGFPEDETYHRFWDIPACKCPKVDNIEKIGSPYKVINMNCPLHGSE
jgi:hypothetical protein